MNLPKPPPPLLAGIGTIIPLVLALVVSFLIGGGDYVSVSRAMVINVSGGVLSVVFGLALWVFTLLVKDHKGKKDYRRSQVSKWRETINSGFEQLEFCDTVLYSELRPHLSKATLDSIEGNKFTIRLGRGGNLIKSLVLDDIAELEKRWDLI